MKTVDHGLLDEIMYTLDYKKERKFVYRALWSNDEVSHYILFDVYAGGHYLTANFAFKNLAIEAVAYDIFVRYSGMPAEVQDAKYKFTMRFGFGFLKPKITGWSVFLPESSPSQLADFLISETKAKLFPVIKPIHDSRALYDRLMSDEEPCMWYQTNGAIRATHLLQFGMKAGISLKTVREALETRKRWIAIGVHGVDPDWYLDRACDQLSQ